MATESAGVRRNPLLMLPSHLWRVHYLVKMLGIAVLYCAVAFFSTTIPGINPQLHAVWPAAGVSLACLVLYGRQYWPGIALGAGILAFLLSTPFIPACLLVLGSTLQPWLGSWLLSRLRFSSSLDSLQEVQKFIIGGALLPTLIGALLNTWAGYKLDFYIGEPFRLIWWEEWVGDGLGILLAAPILLTWFQRRTISRRPQQLLAISIWLCLLLALGWVVFCSRTRANYIQYPLEYLPLLLIVWAALRFGQRGTASSTAIVSGMAVWGLARDSGPFLVQADNLTQAILSLQTFIGSIAVTATILSAGLAERQRSESRYRAMVKTLDLKVADRTNELERKNQELSASLQVLKETQQQLIQSEKMSSLGQLVGGIAHEINNPVNFIYGNLRYTSDYVGDLLQLIDIYQQHYPEPDSAVQVCQEEIDLNFLREDLPNVVASMKIGAERIRQIVLSLQNFSQLDRADINQVNIHEGIDSALLLLQNRLKGKTELFDIQVERDYGNLPLVECYAGQLNQVFMNILANAIDAIAERNAYLSEAELKADPGKIQICTREGGYHHVQIHIIDNGAGMEDSVQKQIFDPFFTTKPVGKGTGLGLSVSYQIIIERHRGSLKCKSSPGEGTMFSIEIPVWQSYPMN